MSGLPPLLLPFALWLVSGSGPAVPPVATELPAGSGPLFRARMLSWAARAPEPIAAPEPPARASIALPRLSSTFGYRSDPFRGARALHAGVDIPGPMGEPIQAAAGGVVRFAGAAHGYGNLVEIDHGNGLSTRYAHLSYILVAPGAVVTQGERIALMGSTGRSTGSHLHFEVRDKGLAVDPLRYLGGESESVAAARPAGGSSEPHVSAYARARDAASNQAKGTSF